ncbi:MULTISPECIES: PilW family protein [Francisella]|uniref:Prepilin-type N-terminal cleavage/methylation domain-containing protein n=2 Tax=Francisella TaxID=262 RepID=A0AAJ4TKT0_9GAMM|nr:MULTISPECIES: prepilin-type N-terminal cleavage/methylation domain-containing protein [Francisella]QEO57505.1 prepilin-type N-terminal cleavage/methylation domain-containing protein [Francisella marina]QEO58376.1 prepilin-type N-terminal cleavage/methylation domain-containing protein [Francisella marina]QWU98999.1 prepilin-type N-terminal cleavage/methylation domain-containing protein [Francisella salimarina]
MVLKRVRKCAGFSLPELMVAMVIAAIVMGMAVGIYIDMKKQYIRLSDKHRINSDQLLIKQIFYNAIGQAGFTTKYGDIYQQLVDNSGDNFGDIFGKMGIVTIGKSPAQNFESLPKGLSMPVELCKERMLNDEALRDMNIDEDIHCVQPESDFLMIQRSSLDSTLKSNSSNNIFKVNEFQKDTLPEKDLSMNDYLVLCNSYECDLVKVGAVTYDFVSTTKRVESKFKIGDYVGKYILEVFFVASTNKKDKDGNEIYSLYEYVKQNADDSQIYELISDVTDLKIEYVLNSDIQQGNAKIDWKSLKKELVNIKSDSTAALKISFKVAGQETSKIYLLGQD